MDVCTFQQFLRFGFINQIYWLKEFEATAAKRNFQDWICSFLYLWLSFS